MLKIENRKLTAEDRNGIKRTFDIPEGFTAKYTIHKQLQEPCVSLTSTYEVPDRLKSYYDGAYIQNFFLGITAEQLADGLRALEQHWRNNVEQAIAPYR